MKYTLAVLVASVLFSTWQNIAEESGATKSDIQYIAWAIAHVDVPM